MKKLGITYQLRLTTLIPVFLIAVLFAVVYNGKFARDLDQHLTRLGQAYIRQLLPAAQLAMMREDRRTLQGLINASTVNPEIKALVFYDAKGKILAYRGGKHAVNKPFNPPEFTGDYIESTEVNPSTINFLAPITLPRFNLYSAESLMDNVRPKSAYDDIIGWLSIDIDTQSLLVKKYQMYMITIFITLLGLLISLAVHFFLSRRLSKPIARLEREMKQVLNNHFSVPIRVSSSGEIGTIEKGISYLQKHYLTTVHDLNHQIEVATADLQQNLELVEEKNIQLSLEKKKIEEKSQLKSEFIASMSHEIRTPMNGVIGFTNVLLESKLDPLQLDYVKTIKLSAKDLLNIINDILDYSKIDAGKLTLDSIPLDYRTCVDEVLALSAPTAYKKGVDLIPSTDISVPKMVLGDPLRLRQILTNLVTNAIKFTEHGYVLVRTRVEEETDHDYTFAIDVEDTGMGISEEDQAKLFTAFNQADTSITRRFGGTGLGLAICKKLVEAMQGKISLASELRKGSVFTVKVKFMKLVAYEVEKNQSQRFQHLKALCFDDNSLHLEATCNGLGYLGIDCVRVTALEELQEAFAKHDCHIAYISVNEGCELSIAAILKQQTIPCVLISKWIISDPESYGGKFFLFKPVSIQKFYETLETVQNPTKSVLPVGVALENLRKQLRFIHPYILIAEDNPVNRMLLDSLLKDYASIDYVEDGEAAVKKCQEKRYDILLIDLQMPKLNGLQATHKIRQESMLNKQTPVILISANSSDSDRENQQKSGIDLYLQKPIDEQQLFSELVHILKKHKAHAIDWPLCIQKVSGNKKLAQDFLVRFVEELAQNREEFLKLYNEQDLVALEAAAHKLHGACCFCGVPFLHAQVTQVEMLAKNAKAMSDLEQEFIELIQRIDDVLDEYEKFFKPEKTVIE